MTGATPLVRLVVDANRIVSALLRDGSTREAILKTRAELFAPEFLREEIAKHMPLIARRVGVPDDQVTIILDLLLRRITWVPPASYTRHLARAGRALRHVDPKDVPYLACAVAVKADAIWSLDLDFDRQSLVPRVPHPEARLP